jgi:antitoxin VapB
MYIMGKALHISNATASRLARKLAKQTGETLTDAVIRALEEKLERDTRAKHANEDAKVAELLAIAERAIGLQAEGKSSRELIDELYDENGLPV